MSSVLLISRTMYSTRNFLLLAMDFATIMKTAYEVKRMGNHGQFQRQSRKMALCGMMAALSVAVLTWGSLIPFSTFTCPMLAMLCLIPSVCEYGPSTALTMYAAVSVLGLLLCPDKEISLLYIFLGWYPSVQTRLDTPPAL